MTKTTMTAAHGFLSSSDPELVADPDTPALSLEENSAPLPSTTVESLNELTFSNIPSSSGQILAEDDNGEETHQSTTTMETGVDPTSSNLPEEEVSLGPNMPVED